VQAPRASTAAEWRVFLGHRYRHYQGIGVTSATVFALAGDGLTIPLLLGLGTPPGLATIIGVLPYGLSAAQLLVPGILRRSGGNLRLVTLAILAVGETRGLLLAAIVVATASGSLPPVGAIAAITVTMSVAGAASAIGGANLLAWYGAVLSEPERRFVSPRVMAITQGLGATLLLPVALLVQVGLGSVGVVVYAAVFAVAGLAGAVEVVVVARMRRPGRVRVAAGAATAPLEPETRRFVRVVALASFGSGLGPYLSIYAMSVLALPAGFAIALSAIAAGSSLITSTIVGGWLHRGSASRLLRASFVVRGGAMFLGLAAFPGNPLAWLVLCCVAAIVSAGAAAGTLAANERLLRLTGGVNLIGAQARYVAWTSLALTGGQLISGTLLAVAPLGYPVFAFMFTASGAFRVVLAPRVEVGPAWTSATGAFDIAALHRGSGMPDAALDRREAAGLPGVPPPQQGQPSIAAEPAPSQHVEVPGEPAAERRAEGGGQPGSP
jgi:hypothetical protein